MKGVYIRCICPYVPLVEELIQWVGPSFYACHSAHIDGEGYVVDIVSEEFPRMTHFPWPAEVHDITCLEFFAESIMVTETGICVRDGARIPHEPRSHSWRKDVGKICYFTNSVEISHPSSLQSYHYT